MLATEGDMAAWAVSVVAAAEPNVEPNVELIVEPNGELVVELVIELVVELMARLMYNHGLASSDYQGA